MNKLKDKYYDPKTGLISYSKFIKKVNLPITNDKVKDFIENQEVHQLTRKPNIIKFNSIYVPNPRDNYQIDLMNYDRYEYNNYKYILCVIDVNSRFAACRALKNRTMNDILDNLKNIFEDMGIPKAINADQEFNKSLFNKYFEDNNIKTYFSLPDQPFKNAIVERFNRTLAHMLQKWRVSSDKYNWHSVLNDIVFNYNNTYHTTIKNTPESVFNGDNLNEQTINYIPNPFKINDKVRILLSKTIFDKGDKLKYSEQVYEVTNIDEHRIFLNNDNSIYYKPYQLLKVNKVETNEKNKEEKKIHNEIKINKKINKDLKKIGLSNENIINTKRTIKKKKIFDL